MPFEKGISGNPGGRAKTKELTDALRIVSREVVTETKKIKLRAVAEKLFDLAMGGDVSAIREIGDRLDGKALASVDINATVTDLTDAERRNRLIELLEFGAASRVALPSGTGTPGPDQGEPEIICPVH
jgi:Family of unknown function (DUF5681)